MAYTGTLTPPDGITLNDSTQTLSNGTILVEGYSYDQEKQTSQNFLLNYAGTGELNTAFGDGGRIAAPPGFNIWYNQTVGDKIQVGGSKWNETIKEHEYYLARYDFSGKPDNSFGVNGFLTPPLGVVLTIYPNTYWDGGSIFAVALKDGAEVLMRFDKAGKFDNSYGASGYLTAPSDVQFNNGFSKLNDGSFLISGNLRDDPTTTDINESRTSVLVSYRKNGTLNTDFGVGGKITAPAGYYLWANQQPYGKIQVQGNTLVDNSYSEYYVAQYTSEGKLDTGFGINGVLTPPNGVVMTSYPQTNWQDGTLFAPGKKTDGSNVLLRFSASGKIDTRFGENGRGYIDSPEGVILGNSVSTLRDGGYLVAASSASNNGGGAGLVNNNILVRYTKNWALDDSFGDGGKITAEPGYYLWANEVGAGKLWVVGNKWVEGQNQYYAAQYTSDGKLDTSFGNNGILTPPNGFVMTGYPMTYWKDGSIYVSGEKADGTDVLIHFTSSGKIDTTFGSSGQGYITTPSGISFNQGITTLAGGGYLLSGQSNDNNGNGSSTGVLLRYNAQWKLDTSFGTGGIFTAPAGYSLWANEVTGGKIQLQGNKFEDGKSTFLFAQLTANGKLDTSFGVGGFMTPPSGISNTGYICQLSDGRFTTTGETANGASVLIRFSTNGKIDKTFGFGNPGAQSGYIIAPSGITLNSCPTTLLDGSYLISGQSTNGTGFIYRYSQVGVLDTSFGDQGKIQGREGFYLWAQEISGGKLQVNGNKWSGGSSQEYLLQQYTKEGKLDSSFGTGGSLAAPQGFVFDQIQKSQSTGEFLAIAREQNGSRIILAQYSKNGTLNTNFWGRDGIMDISSTQFGWMADFRVLADGALLVASYSNSGPGMTLSRFKSDGTLDSAFGSQGVLEVEAAALKGVPTGIALSTYQQPLLCSDGSFLIAGNKTDGTDTAVLIRYTSSGGFDQQFGTNGYIIAPTGITSLNAVQMPDGGFGVIGSANGSFYSIDFIAKYNANGQKDNSVGVNGVLVAPKGTKFTNIILQEDGSILASVVSTDENTPGITQILRYNSDGRLDQSSGGVVYTASGQDILAQAGNGNNRIVGGGGNDSLAGGEGRDTVLAGAGNDTVYAGSGNDSVNGGAGNDLLIGGNGAGNDTYDGGSGNNTVKYTSARAGISVNLASGRASSIQLPDLAGIGFDTLVNIQNIIAGNFNDSLIGNSQANSIWGESGNDTIDGGLGSDTMSGGAGNDRYLVDNVGDLAIEGVNAGSDTVEASVGYTLGANVENLVLAGSGAINGTGNGLNNLITGNAGANVLNGGLGSDTMSGGAGNDRYLVDNVGDLAIEGVNAGSDTVEASVGYTLGANVENLVLMGTSPINGTGNELNNLITGNAGANVLNGGLGSDTMSGGAGNDRYIVDNVGDLAVEGVNAGSDTVEASVSYTLGANVENLVLMGTSPINGTGNELNNLITGNAGANVLNGGLGSDTMSGGGGNDTLNAFGKNGGTIQTSGFETDLMRGGAGVDTFVLGEANGSYYLDAGKLYSGTTSKSDASWCVITDFEVGVDQVQLSQKASAQYDIEYYGDVKKYLTRQVVNAVSSSAGIQPQDNDILLFQGAFDPNTAFDFMAVIRTTSGVRPTPEQIMSSVQYV